MKPVGRLDDLISELRPRRRSDKGTWLRYYQRTISEFGKDHLDLPGVSFPLRDGTIELDLGGQSKATLLQRLREIERRTAKMAARLAKWLADGMEANDPEMTGDVAKRLWDDELNRGLPLLSRSWKELLGDYVEFPEHGRIKDSVLGLIAPRPPVVSSHTDPIFIIAPGGHGKSMLVRKIFDELVGSGNTSILFMSGLDLNFGASTALEAIRAQIQRRTGQAVFGGPRWKKVTLFIDGFDEIRGDNESLVGRISELLGSFHGLVITVTDMYHSQCLDCRMSCNPVLHRLKPHAAWLKEFAARLERRHREGFAQACKAIAEFKQLSPLIMEMVAEELNHPSPGAEGLPPSPTRGGLYRWLVGRLLTRYARPGMADLSAARASGRRFLQRLAAYRVYESYFLDPEARRKMEGALSASVSKELERGYLPLGFLKQSDSELPEFGVPSVGEYLSIEAVVDALGSRDPKDLDWLEMFYQMKRIEYPPLHEYYRGILETKDAGYWEIALPNIQRIFLGLVTKRPKSPLWQIHAIEALRPLEELALIQQPELDGAKRRARDFLDEQFRSQKDFLLRLATAKAHALLSGRDDRLEGAVREMWGSNPAAKKKAQLNLLFFEMLSQARSEPGENVPKEVLYSRTLEHLDERLRDRERKAIFGWALVTLDQILRAMDKRTQSQRSVRTALVPIRATLSELRPEDRECWWGGLYESARKRI